MEVEDSRLTHLGPGEGRVLRAPGGELVTCKVAPEQTGGAYSIFEASSRPGGGPPPHVQHWEDECFYILEGEFEFLLENERSTLGMGSIVYVPKGTLHTHTNVGKGAGRLLVSQTPGGTHERFCEAVGEAQVTDGRDIAKVAAEYGIEIVTQTATGGRKEKRDMERRVINPWTWQDAFAYVQANEVTGAPRTIYCAGVTSVDEEGKAAHPGDMRAQIGQAMDNLEAILKEAGAGLSDVVRLNVYTTDVDRFFEAFDALANRLAEAGCHPASTLLGITRLTFPELMVEIEATAVA